MMSENQFDAILIVSFGGPEGMDDVMPFLENVLRGKNVPRERMLEVYEHYRQFGGVSPINQQNRSLVEALKTELKNHHLRLPIYFGNRNWHPLLADTLKRMKDDGVKRALAFFTSMYSCYSGCRQYRENIAEAQRCLGEAAPDVFRLRLAFNHPFYIEAVVDRMKHAIGQMNDSDLESTRILFSAHSIPLSMAENCQYETQLRESCRLVMQYFPRYQWELVYQSRSGPPSQPWLEPDICDRIEHLKEQVDLRQVIVMPIGFISDHIEVLFDLDQQAKEKCDALGIQFCRAETVGIHPKFIAMIRELIEERFHVREKKVIGNMPANWDVCPADCCLYSRTSR
jgi:protoporphyrin/coproporphyrin ferrochelatase